MVSSLVAIQALANHCLSGGNLFYYPDANPRDSNSTLPAGSFCPLQLHLVRGGGPCSGLLPIFKVEIYGRNRGHFALLTQRDFSAGPICSLSSNCFPYCKKMARRACFRQLTFKPNHCPNLTRTKRTPILEPCAQSCLTASRGAVGWRGRAPASGRVLPNWGIAARHPTSR
jgi:hypothetical protein